MARNIPIKLLRTTRANLATQTTANELLEGEPYFVTDESRIAIGTSSGSSVDMAKKSEVPTALSDLSKDINFDERYYTESETDTLLSGKQDSLVSGTNIKTINSTSLLGAGNITAGGLTNFTESNYTYSSKTGVKLTPNNAATNVDILLQPKGTGGIIAQQPDGTTTGGNNRGTYALDLQRLRDDKVLVASGSHSVILAGDRNKASSSYSVVLSGITSTTSGLYALTTGYFNTASGTSSVAFGSMNIASGTASSVIGGQWTTASMYGQISHANGDNAANTASQASTLLMRGTTQNSNTELFLDGNSARLVLRSNSILSCLVDIVGKTSGAVNGYQYSRQVLIAKGETAASTVLLNSNAYGGDYEQVSSVEIAISADTTNGSLKILINAADAGLTYWTAIIRNIEVMRA